MWERRGPTRILCLGCCSGQKVSATAFTSFQTETPVHTLISDDGGITVFLSQAPIKCGLGGFLCVLEG